MQDLLVIAVLSDKRKPTIASRRYQEALSGAQGTFMRPNEKKQGHTPDGLIISSTRGVIMRQDEVVDLT
jgi:hypothetical protein